MATRRAAPKVVSIPVAPGVCVLRAAACVLLMSGSVGGCTAPRSTLPQVAPAAVEAEQYRQLVMFLEVAAEQDARLWRIAWPLLRTSTPFCPARTVHSPGMTVGSLHAFSPDDRTLVAEAVGLGDTVQVTRSVEGGPAHQAGLRVRDLVLAVDGVPVDQGPAGLDHFAFLQEPLIDGTVESLDLTLLRDGTEVSVALEAGDICDYDLIVNVSNELNAVATGDAVVVNTGMMRFANDDELAVVLGHELSHNSLGHIDALRSNTLLGGILGAVADVFVTYATGASTRGQYTQMGMDIGSRTYSQEFESEADYVGLYLLARAGLDPSSAPAFWRSMAIANPTSISISTTHPTTAERFVRLDRGLTEVMGKEARGLAMVPDGDFDWASRNPALAAPPDRVAFPLQDVSVEAPSPVAISPSRSELQERPADSIPLSPQLRPQPDTVGIENEEQAPTEGTAGDPDDQLQPLSARTIPGIGGQIGFVRAIQPDEVFAGPWRDGVSLTLSFDAAVSERIQISLEGSYARFSLDRSALPPAHALTEVDNGSEAARFASAILGTTLALRRPGTPVRPFLSVVAGMASLKKAWIPEGGGAVSGGVFRVQNEWGPIVGGGVGLGFDLGGPVLLVTGRYLVLFSGTGQERGYPHLIGLSLGLATGH